jgi:hypothetical protein
MDNPQSGGSSIRHGFFSDFHRWNARLCVPVGLVFNCLMAWLVLRKTPKQMRMHSRVLLQNCVLDSSILLLVLSIGIPVIFKRKLHARIIKEFDNNRARIFLHVLCNNLEYKSYMGF